MLWFMIACFDAPAPQVARQDDGIDVDMDVDADADREPVRRVPRVPLVKPARVAQAR